MADNKVISQSIELTGAAKYRQELSESKQALSVLRSELKATTAGFTQQTTAEEKNRATAVNLRKQMEMQQQVVATTEKRYEELAKKYGENSKQANSMKVKLNEARAAMLTTRSKVRDLDSEYEKMQNAAKDAADGNDKLKKGLKETETQAEKTASGFGKLTTAAISFNQITSAVGTLVSGLKSGLSSISNLASGIVDSITSVVSEVASAADELLTQSVNSGMSVDTLNKLRYASNAGYDVDVSAITGAVGKLRRGGMTSKEAKKLFKGTSLVSGADRVTNADGTTRAATAEETFWNVMSRMNNAYRANLDENGNLDAATMQKMDSIMNTLFGKGFQDLMTLVTDPEGLWEKVQQGQNSGMISTTAEQELLGSIDDAMQTVKANITSIKERFVLLFGEDFLSIYTDLQTLTESAMKFLRSVGIGDEEGATSAMTDIRTTLSNLGNTIVDAVQKAWGFIKTGLTAISEETDENGNKTVLARIATWLLELPEKVSNAWTQLVEFFESVKKIINEIARFLGINAAEERQKQAHAERVETLADVQQGEFTFSENEGLVPSVGATQTAAQDYADALYNYLTDTSGDWGTADALDEARVALQETFGESNATQINDMLEAINAFVEESIYNRDYSQDADITLPAEWFTQSIQQTNNAVTQTPAEVESGAKEGAEAGIRAGLKGVVFNVHYDVDEVSTRVMNKLAMYG